MAVYKIAATKANLQKSRETLRFLRIGYDLLDKKRIVLIREQTVLRQKARDLLGVINTVLHETTQTMNYLYVTMGSSVVEHRAQVIPIDDTIDIVYHSMMGVSVPELSHDEDKNKTVALRTDPAFSHAISTVQELKARMLEYVAAKTAADLLQREIDKTQKRANALDKVQIPRYEQIVYNIEQILEEKEREEFFRLKRVKKAHVKTKSRKADQKA